MKDVIVFAPLKYTVSFDGKQPRKPIIRIERAWIKNNVSTMLAGIVSCGGCDGLSIKRNLLIATPSRCYYD